MDSIATILIQHIEIVAATSLSDCKMQGVVQEDEGEGFNVDVQKRSRSPIPITPEMPGSGSKYIERTRIDDLASFTWDHATLVKLAKTS